MFKRIIAMIMVLSSIGCASLQGPKRFEQVQVKYKVTCRGPDCPEGQPLSQESIALAVEEADRRSRNDEKAEQSLALERLGIAAGLIGLAVGGAVLIYCTSGDHCHGNSGSTKKIHVNVDLPPR